MNLSEDIISRDSELDPIVYGILNEAYHEFIQVYGEKHSNRIKERIELVTDKVRKASLYYDGPIAQANAYRRCNIH